MGVSQMGVPIDERQMKGSRGEINKEERKVADEAIRDSMVLRMDNGWSSAGLGNLDLGISGELLGPVTCGGYYLVAKKTNRKRTRPMI